jgi:hypothetical protein
MYICEGSCIYVRGHVYMLGIMYICEGSCKYVRGFDWYVLSIRFCNLSDDTVFFVYHFIITVFHFTLEKLRVSSCKVV